MTTDQMRTSLQLRSLVRSRGELELSLVSVAIPDLAPDEVLVRIDASPLNPSDLGLLFGAADLSTATWSGTAAHPVVTARIPDKMMKAVAGRLDESMPVGNEGAGVVVTAGSSAAAQALLGKTVALIGGAMDLLRALGATHVCNASAPTFMQELTEALAATGATIAFDATGGGKLAGQILTCMEAALNKTAKAYSRYGSPIHKQVYIYGRLDQSPTELTGNFGMAWGMGGWLLFSFLQNIGPAAAQMLRERVIAELNTTFASHYSRTVSLAEALQPDAISAYSKRATGEKYLINPNKGVPYQE
jgi:hypothetical protein